MLLQILNLWIVTESLVWDEYNHFIHRKDPLTTINLKTNKDNDLNQHCMWFILAWDYTFCIWSFRPDIVQFGDTDLKWHLLIILDLEPCDRTQVIQVCLNTFCAFKTYELILKELPEVGCLFLNIWNPWTSISVILSKICLKCIYFICLPLINLLN